MAEVITMPRLSDTMEEGTVASWLKKVGDKVEEGDILAEIETDKATMEFESFYEGTLLYIGINEGETANVDALLAIVGAKGEDISALINGNTLPAPSEETKASHSSSDYTATTTPTLDATGNVPEGVEVITMPRLSDTMEEGTVASWLKKVGDKIEEGDILAEIETDKATMEFESFYSGTLLQIGVHEGETAKVDALLAIIGPSGTDVSTIAVTKTANSDSNVAAVASTTKVVKTNKELPLASSAQQSSVAATHQTRIFASPLAKKLAEDKNIDLSKIRGSGENGRIIKKDIEMYTTGNKGVLKGSEEVLTSRTSSFSNIEDFVEVSNSQMRKTIAKRLGESKFTAPHYYLTVELDMDAAIASRKAINSNPEVKISFNDMIVKACAMALRKHPKVNSQWTEKTTRIASHIHIGVAVAVEDGLLVPVLKFADQMSFSQIGFSVKELAGKARNKKLTPEEMQGSTFTVSNLGMFGIKEFTSIINQPNSAILSVGAIVQKPVVKNETIVVGNTMTVTLACDHRTVDGATGAAFLKTLRSYIENPLSMFV